MKLVISTLLLCFVASASLALAAPEAVVTPAPPAPMTHNLERRQDFWTLVNQATSNLNSEEIASFNSLLESATNYGDLFTNSGFQSALNGASNGPASAISSIVSANSDILTSALGASSASSIISRLTSQTSGTTNTSPTPTTSPGQDDNDGAQPNGAVVGSSLGSMSAAFAALGGAALIIVAL